MFVIITHITHIYLHPIYKMPQINLSTTIMYMQILMILMVKKTIWGWLNHNICSLMTEIILKKWPLGHSMYTSLSITHIYLPALPLVGGPCQLL